MLNQSCSVSPHQQSLSKRDATKVAKALEASPNEVYIVDWATLTFEYANPRAIRNLGYSLATLQKMTLFDVAIDLEAVGFNELVTPLINHQVTQMNLETIHRRADGSSYPVEVYLQLVEEQETLSFFAIVVDITQRKSAEQSLQKKSQELANVANNIPGAIYRLHYFLDGAVKVEYVSDRAEEILEVAIADLYADFNNFSQLVHHEDRDRLSIFLKKALTDLTPSFWEGRLVTPSQRLIWVQVHSQAQKQRDGSVIRYGVLLDITAQKEAELALQESEAKFRQFAENIDDIFWMIDPNLNQLFYVSPAYEKIWGYPPDAVLENPVNFLQHIHPEDRPTVEKAISQPILEKNDTEYRIIRPDGEIRWLRDRAFPIKNQAGEIYRVAGIAQDITEEKNTARELSRNRELREVIFEEATDALYLIDPSTLNILDCNWQAVRLSVAPNKEAIINREAYYLYESPFSQIKTALNEQGIWNEEVILTPFQGEQFFGDVIWKKIEVTEQTLYLVRLTDISERKAFERELQTANESLKLTNQELARATQLKDQFLANMSHELRTPLNAILGMSEGLFQCIDEQQQQAVKTINTSANHLLALINDILDLAKIQADKISLNLTEVTLTHLCETSLRFIHQDALRKKISLKTEIQTSVSSIYVDELRMRQVLINLLNNAVKFTPEGGKVTLRVTEKPQKEQIIFAVIDTGIGIPPDQVSRLFEPFVQLDSQLSRQYSGTGLGLSLVRRLTELQGGEVTVESQVGYGSCFAVSLPYAQVAIVSGEKTDHYYSQDMTQLSRSPSILLINSDRATLDTNSSYLEASGYQVTSLEQWEAFRETIDQFFPDVIVIDLSEFEGKKTTMIQELSQYLSPNPTPLIAVTTNTTLHLEKEELLHSGAHACLVKPIRLRHLLNQIQKLLPEEFQL